MDQRRILLFLVLSFGVLMLNSMLVAPPRKPQQPKPKAAQEQKAEPAEAAPAEQADSTPAPSEAANPPEPAELPAAVEVPQQYLTLGSVDPDSAYRLGVTFTNHGAAVRRVELASPRYRDLEDRGGYLGHLELVPDPAGGLLVRAVVAGTPADRAGIAVGDRLVSAEDRDKEIKLDQPEVLTSLLARRRPKSKLTLSVAHGEDAPHDVEVTLGRRPLEVIRPESENVLMRGVKLPEGFVEPPSFLLTLEQIGTTEIPDLAAEIPGVKLLESNWEVVSSNAREIVFRQVVSQQQLEVVKRFTLEPIPTDQQKDRDYPGYNLELALEIRNLGGQAADIAYRLDGPNGLPLEGWWYARKFGRNWGAAGLRDIVGRYFGSDTAEESPSKIATGDAKDFEGGSMAFMGVDAQYFAAMLLPHKQSPDEIWMEVVRPVLLGPAPKPRSHDAFYSNVTCRLISKKFTVQPAESLKHTYTVFAGPKRPELLANYRAVDNAQYSLGDLLYYGWFGAVARAMLGILHFFYAIVRNYGLAIIMLTVLVRLCMVPVSRKQAQSMVKMQELKPELDKLKEKYKGDTTKQSQAMQELYRKHNINPLAGCLPMFIQLPIFIGLYRSLAVDVELRQAPLISDAIHWCSNLAAPDMLLNWSSFMPALVTSGEGFFGLGRYLNVLPLVTVTLFILQQKILMPEPANEQAASQQKMMQYMMIFFAFMFYKVASGLCIYFIASSIWGITERKLMPMPKAATAAAGAAGGTPPAKSITSAPRNDRPKKKR